MRFFFHKILIWGNDTGTEKAAHAADFNDYTDLGAVGFLGDLVYTWGILNNAATVATNTTVVPTDAAYEEYVVKVDITGAVLLISKVSRVRENERCWLDFLNWL